MNNREDRFEQLDAHPMILARRIAALERQLEALQSEMDPISQTIHAGQLLGKILFILGGIVLGLTSMYAAFSGWVGAHLK